MFWGLILKANRKYTQTIKKSFHLSHAALDITSSSGGHVQVVLTSDKNDYILCTLKKDSVEQVPLDLNFEEGEEISFTSQGQGNVHLTGYLVIDDLDQLDEEDDDDQDEQLMLASKKKKVEKVAVQKGEEDSDDDDDDDEGLEEDSSDEEEDDSEDESEEEEAQEPVSNKRKLEKPKQNGIDKQAPNKKVKKEQTVTEPPTKGEKTLPGGIKIEDIRVGQGPEAKPGKKVQVYYEGRLKSNNKVFDSTKNGPGFKFGLGKGEVIKAWDIGVAGMKVGGKRKIVCPPHMAYGSKGSPPVIPPNSTLVFEVELKGVN